MNICPIFDFFITWMSSLYVMREGSFWGVPFRFVDCSSMPPFAKRKTMLHEFSGWVYSMIPLRSHCFPKKKFSIFEIRDWCKFEGLFQHRFILILRKIVQKTISKILQLIWAIFSNFFNAANKMCYICSMAGSYRVNASMIAWLTFFLSVSGMNSSVSNFYVKCKVWKWQQWRHKVDDLCLNLWSNFSPT